MLNEVNTIREKMGLQPLNEVELLELQISKLDLDNLDEGMWEKIKGGLAKLGSYKKGGVALAKLKTNRRDDITGNTIGAKFDRSGWNPANWELQTRWGVTKAAEAKIKAILEKENNQIIRDLDAQIKRMAPDFPNTTDQLKFVETVAAIGGVYDTIVAHSQLEPNDKNYLTDVQANSLIDDLREYVKKFLDYDLSAVFSAFNEGEEIGEASNPAQQAAIAISKKEKEGLVEEMVDINEIGIEEDKARDAEIERQKTQLAAKAADTKAAIKKGELQAYDSTRMKTLKSWTLPTLMGLSGVGWLVKGLLTPDEVKTMTTEELEKVTEKRLEPNLLATQEYGDGITQCMNKSLRTLGSNITITPNSSPADLKQAFAEIGGGDYKKGIEYVTAQKGICKNPVEARQIMTAVVTESEFKDKKLVQIFKGVWAGTGKVIGDLLTTVRGGQIVGMVVNTATIWKTKTITTTVATAAAGKKGLIFMGGAAIAGAVALALLRYKGRKSSRAQILNDLMQRLRPIALSDENPIDPNPEPNPDPNKTNLGNSENELYILLKKYFKDLYNYKSQVTSKDFYKTTKAPAKPNQQAPATSAPVTSGVEQSDVDDLATLMENFSYLNEIKLEDLNLSSNELKLLKSGVDRLNLIKKVMDRINSKDTKLMGLINAAKKNPFYDMDVYGLINDITVPAEARKFVNDFNAAVYNTKFKNGNSIIDQLGKIQINKLNEKAEREPSKAYKAAQFTGRGSFQRDILIKNLSGYLVTLYSIFSYLIDNLNAKPQGNKPAQADYLPGQDKKSTDKAQVNKGLNAGNTGNTFGGFRAAGQNLEEGTVISKAEMIAIMIEEARSANPVNVGDANQEINLGRFRKLLSALALVAPEYSTRIAKGYNEMYPNDPNISPVVLKNFLTVSLNGLSVIPEGWMKTYIKRSGGDVSAFISALNKVDEANDNLDSVKGSSNYKIMMALSSVIPAFQSRIAATYNQMSPNDRLSAPKLAGFLQNVLMGAAMIPRSKMRGFIIDGGGDIGAWTKALNAINKPEGGDVPTGEFSPETFKPENVNGFDLGGQKDEFRTALAKKAVEVIQRKGGNVDEKNVLRIMGEIITMINKSYPDKQIPMAGQPA